MSTSFGGPRGELRQKIKNVVPQFSVNTLDTTETQHNNPQTDLQSILKLEFSLARNRKFQLVSYWFLYSPQVEDLRGIWRKIYEIGLSVASWVRSGTPRGPNRLV